MIAWAYVSKLVASCTKVLSLEKIIIKIAASMLEVKG